MRAWRALAREQRQAAGAALALALTMFLPWYSKDVVVPRSGHLFASDSLSAFQVFTFVEAAVLFVAGAVLYLLYARAKQRAFHLPGGDGWAVTLGGGWVVFLLVWRLFDKPHVSGGGATVGVEWGLFVAMAVGVALLTAGQRMRAAHRPEPPNPAEDPTWEIPTRSRGDDPRRRPADPEAVTAALRTRPPSWEGEPPEHPGRATPAAVPHAADPAEAQTRKLPTEEPPEEGQPRLF